MSKGKIKAVAQVALGMAGIGMLCGLCAGLTTSATEAKLRKQLVAVSSECELRTNQHVEDDLLGQVKKMQQEVDLAARTGRPPPDLLTDFIPWMMSERSEARTAYHDECLGALIGRDQKLKNFADGEGIALTLS